MKLKGFRSFGPEEVVISFQEKLAAFIGLNSAGKTSALEALRKIFGSSLTEREISRQDFHIGKDENFEEISGRELSIEVRIDFSEEEQEAVPHFFSNMVVDDMLGDLYVRIRLDATWKQSGIIPLGEIEVRTNFIITPEGEQEQEDSKRPFPNHYRSLIQILYVPAIRRPAEQLKYASGSIMHRVLRKIKSSDQFKQEFDEKIEEINGSFKGLPEFNTVQTSITEFWQKFHKDERYREAILGFGVVILIPSSKSWKYLLIRQVLINPSGLMN